MKSIFESISNIIPQSLKEIAGKSLKSIFIFLFGLFTTILKFVLNLDWLTFVGLIILSVVLVIAVVFVGYFFKKINLNKNKEEFLRKTFLSENKIEIVKLQEKLITELTKFGYISEEGVTLKEYLLAVAAKNPELNSEIEEIIDKIYFARYSDFTISKEDILQCRTKIDSLLNNISQKKKNLLLISSDKKY